ncbi:MAG TPA: restriction endonuclease subunit S [archaeon]|nr:restriction endonuclease subunit S [archaeon]
MKQYEKYKDSELPWLEKMPTEWKVLKAKYFMKEINEKSEKGNEKLLSVSEYYGIKPREQVIEKDDFLSHADTLEGYKKCFRGDIVMNIMLAWKKSLGMSDYNGIVSPAYSVFRLSNENIPKFFHYFFRTDLLAGEFKRYSTGIIESRLRLYPDTFLSLKFPVPPKVQQEEIVKNLDKQSQKINSLIEKRKKMTELLKEERAAIINQAVTKGINPKAKMKESGIEWIGKIPEDWNIKRLASLGKFSKGSGISRENLTEEGQPVILYGDIYTKYNIRTTKVVSHISLETAKNSVSLTKGDLLFTGSGETVEDIGKTIVYDGDERVFVGGDIIIFSPENQDNLFLAYSLNSSASQFQKILYARGEIIVHISASKLKNLLVPVPPILEQKQIVKYIETETSKIDETLVKIEKEIALLEEYKTALISEAVTGKIDVRNVA